MDLSEAPEDWDVALLTLGEAIVRGRTDLITLLLKRHGNALAEQAFALNSCKQANAGDNALHLACRLNQVDAVRALLRSGMDICQSNASGEVAFTHLAKESEPLQQAFYMELLQNVCAGNVARVANLLRGGLSASQTDGGPDNTTLLHWAASLGQGRDMVKVLLDGGADPLAKTRAGKTAADEALANGNQACYDALMMDKPATSLDKVISKPVQGGEETALLRRKIEEQDKLVETLRQSVDQLLREHGVRDHVARLQDHVGALTRQLAATAEQRDKLQNLYVSSDREVERLARELARCASPPPVLLPADKKGLEGAEEEDLRERVRVAEEALERERAEANAAVRMHLTYEADLRAEIKALHEELLRAQHISPEDENGKSDDAKQSRSLFGFW